MKAQTTLIIARHGNTFGPDETPRRVGARTDLDLVQSGIVQALELGTYLKKQGVSPVRVVAGPLKRTRQMADIAARILFDDAPAPAIEIDERLREVDYGPDENLTEDQVIARIGREALARWDNDGIVPDGWKADPEQMARDWQDMAADILDKNRGETILVVTSNGVARFAPVITGDFDGFRARHALKLSTGALGTLIHDGQGWTVGAWNLKPVKYV